MSNLDTPQSCEYYNGWQMFHNPVCSAGINPILSYCDNDRTGWVNKAPCFKRNTDAPHCPKQTFLSHEEYVRQSEIRREKSLQSIQNIVVVRPMIVTEHERTGKSSGRIECPICSNTLIWSRAECNGHIHAQCETDGCVGWME